MNEKLMFLMLDSTNDEKSKEIIDFFIKSSAKSNDKDIYDIFECEPVFFGLMFDKKLLSIARIENYNESTIVLTDLITDKVIDFETVAVQMMNNIFEITNNKPLLFSFPLTNEREVKFYKTLNFKIIEQWETTNGEQMLTMKRE